MCPKLEWIYPADARRYLGEQLLPEDVFVEWRTES